LHWAGFQQQQAIDLNALREEGIDRLADELAEHFDFNLLTRKLESFYRI
jgi:adenosylcobyric acid synthase